MNIIENPSVTRDRCSLPRPFMMISMVSTLLIILLRFYHALNFPIVVWDSLAEFAYLGRFYFQVGGIPTITGATLGAHSSANFPPLVPLLYAWFYTLYGGVEELFAKAVSPTYGAFTVLVTYVFSKKIYGSETKAWASAFFLASVPIFMFAAEDCLSDAPLMFYFVSSLFNLYISINNDQRRDRAAIASGLLGGLAAWTKYTGLFVVMISLAIIAVEKFVLKREGGGVNFSLRQVALLLVFFTLLGAPWYLRNWALVGNPVYPHLYQIFGGKDLDPWLMENGFNAHFSKIRELAGLDLSLKSVLLTYFTVFFRLPSFEMLDMGPFLGAFSLVGAYFIFKKRGREDGFIVAWIGVYFIVWRITISTFIRYLVAILPALAILSSHGLCELYLSLRNLGSGIRIFKRTVHTQTILKASLFLLILEGAFLPTMINSIRGYKTWAFVSPFISRDEYLDTRLPGWWRAINYINQETPLDAVILTYDHSTVYYINRTCIFLDEPKVKGVHLANNMEEVMSILRDNNISFILDVRYFEGVYVLQDRSCLYGNLGNSDYFDLIFEEGSVLIYAVKA
ncbi:MAG: ArnT family glycosyltransferase [Candidatus Bathyarchaeia archaeon]